MILKKKPIMAQELNNMVFKKTKRFIAAVNKVVVAKVKTYTHLKKKKCGVAGYLHKKQPKVYLINKCYY